MYRRIAALIWTLLIAVTFSLSAYAADGGMTLRVADAEAPAVSGDEIRVPVAAAANPGYVSASLTVRWDSGALELCAVEFTDLAPDQGTPPAENSGAFTLRVGRSARHENFSGNGLFFTLVFRVSDTAAPGDYTVGLMNTVVLDTDLSYVTVNAIPGTVRLTAADTPTDTQPATAPGAPTAPDESSAPQAPTEAAAAQPASDVYPTEEESGPAVVVTASAQTANTDPIIAPEETDDGEGGSTVPWLTITAVAATLCAAVVVFIRRRKGGEPSSADTADHDA